MEIPSKVRIGSMDYDVELTDEILVLNTQQSLGIIDYDNTKIKIANNIQSKQKQEQTFLHEVVHAITREFKIDFSEDEETIVDKLACGLHQVIRDILNDSVRSIKVGDLQINYDEATNKTAEKISEALTRNFNKSSYR